METAVYVQGASGRLGQSLVALIEKDPAFSLSTSVESADVAIDVSAPAGLKKILEACLEAQKPLVIGTTGYSEEEKKMIQDASGKIPLLYAPNFSFGMALLKEIVGQAAKRVGTEANIEILEAHRKGKKDRPSGSAVDLAEAMERPDLPIHSIRCGDTIGDHSVLFGLDGEELELKHRVHSRTAFAKGALRAALFLKSQRPGYYTLCHLLG